MCQISYYKILLLIYKALTGLGSKYISGVLLCYESGLEQVSLLLKESL